MYCFTVQMNDDLCILRMTEMDRNDVLSGCVGCFHSVKVSRGYLESASTYKYFRLLFGS